MVAHGASRLVSRRTVRSHGVSIIFLSSVIRERAPSLLMSCKAAAASRSFPEAVVFHTVNFFAAVELIVVQGGIGMGMLLFGRKTDAYRRHRRMAKYVMGVFLLQGAPGLGTMYGILPFVFGP